MAQKLVIQSNIPYQIKLRRDDCTPYDGQYGRSYAFYVDATWKDPELAAPVSVSGATWYLQDTEAQHLADIGAGKGAVVRVCRKEEHQGEKRKYAWSFQIVTQPETPGFKIIPFGQNRSTGRLGERPKDPAPVRGEPQATAEAPRPVPHAQAARVHPRAHMDILVETYSLCVEAAYRMFDDEHAHERAVCTNTLFIQMMRDGMRVLPKGEPADEEAYAQAAPPPPTTDEEDQGIPF